MAQDQAIFESLALGATLITPNNRSAFDILRIYSQERIIQELPLCYPYEIFLQRSFAEYRFENPDAPFPLLLSPNQIHFLWSSVLAQDLSGPLNPGLLESVKKAWSLSQKWMLKDLGFGIESKQVKDFQNWSRNFENELSKLSAITTDQLVQFFIDSKLNFKAKHFIWYCFDDFTPAQKALQNYLEKLGCRLEYQDLINSNFSTAFYYKAEDEVNEYAEMLTFAEERAALGDQSIALVIPNIEAKAFKIEQFFKQLSVTETELSFNISLGKALSDFPLVSHALTWLFLDREWFSDLQIKLLLYSPYLAFANSELEARAELWQNSVFLQEAMVSYENLLKALQPKAAKLAYLLDNLTIFPEKASLDEWVELFKQRLSDLGFPGEASLNSENYQCFQRFLSLFDEFQSLTLIQQEFSKELALKTFEALTNQTIFQAKKENAKVQILGLLEASGCVFDSVWISSMNSETIPAKTQFSPFIPINIQKEQLMPYSCAKKEYLLAQKLIERLKNSAKICVFSYAKLTEEKSFLPCSLLAKVANYNGLSIRDAKTPELEYYIESYEIKGKDAQDVLGGTTILANQAKCPFKAFAAHRLHLKSGFEQNSGLSPSERGQLVHTIMEKLWQNLHSQEELLKRSSENLEILIKDHITACLKPYADLRPYSLPTLIQKIEVKRLTKLIKACLNWEKSRPDFVIEALEKEFVFSLANFNFKVRIDRMDRVKDKLWVIDYKTSLPTTTPWKELRPQEPQLLIYALLSESVSTLIFLGLKHGQLSLKGLSEEEQNFLGLQSLKPSESWEAKRELWHKLLEDLANEFSECKIEPNPQSASLCQLCSFHNLCRFSDADKFDRD